MKNKKFLKNNNSKFMASMKDYPIEIIKFK